MSIPINLKNKLLVEARHKCAICEESGVHVHHIDGNKENNDESNLIVLCLRHHDEAEKSKQGRGLSSNLTPNQLRLYKVPRKEKVTSEALSPIPLAPYFAHPYPLQKNFTGREKERKELTDWFDNDSNPVFAYIAIGGMGKSALVWYWLNEDILKKKSSPEGVIWWSFYDKETGFESFLNHAIEYASSGETDPRKIESTRDKMDKLRILLGEKQFLLVLDGVERVLRAYAGMGSPYQGDEVKGDKKEDYNACIEPNCGMFLQMLAGVSKTKTLITTEYARKNLMNWREFSAKN